MLAGVIALVGVYIKANFSKSTPVNALPVELVATFWHFVDILWIYLFVFLMWVS
jgi:cytochrome c oxidase subunit 3